MRLSQRASPWGGGVGKIVATNDAQLLPILPVATQLGEQGAGVVAQVVMGLLLWQLWSHR